MSRGVLKSGQMSSTTDEINEVFLGDIARKTRMIKNSSILMDEMIKKGALMVTDDADEQRWDFDEKPSKKEGE